MKLDMFDTIDGKHWLYNSDNPDERFEVVSLLDDNGDEIDDPDEAIAGVVALKNGFQIFAFTDQMPAILLERMMNCNSQLN